MYCRFCGRELHPKGLASHQAFCSENPNSLKGEFARASSPKDISEDSGETSLGEETDTQTLGPMRSWISKAVTEELDYLGLPSLGDVVPEEGSSDGEEQPEPDEWTGQNEGEKTLEDTCEDSMEEQTPRGEGGTVEEKRSGRGRGEESLEETGTQPSNYATDHLHIPIVTKTFEDENQRGVLTIEPSGVLSPEWNLWNLKLDLLVTGRDSKSLERKIHTQMIPGTIRGQVRYSGFSDSVETFRPFEMEDSCSDRLVEIGDLRDENEKDPEKTTPESVCDHSWVLHDWKVRCKLCRHFMTECEAPEVMKLNFVDEPDWSFDD